MTTTTKPSPTCSILMEDEGERLSVFDEHFTVKVTGGETGNRYAIVSGSVAPGGGPPLHSHPGPETLYVLSGELAFTQRTVDGVSVVHAGPGTILHAPAGAPHRFENVGATRAEIVMVIYGALLDYLRELAGSFPPGSEPELEKMLALSEKYQVETFYDGAGSRPEPARDGAVSAQARALSWKLRQAGEALIADLGRCTPEQWQSICADTGWTVGVQAHHIAAGQAALAGLVQGVIAGQPHPPMTMSLLDQINARHAEEFADVTVAETVALLRENVGAAAERYRALTDEQLALTTEMAEGYVVSVAGIIEHHAIDEIERHGAYLREAAGL